MHTFKEPAVTELERQADLMIAQQLRPRGIVLRSVLDAMRAVPRHLFVSHCYSHRAYADEALPSLLGQTLSQPFIVALMTQELGLAPGMQVLELGTGTGYQTAILARLVGPTGRVFTIENIPALADSARRRLEALGITNVEYLTADGSLGWPAGENDTPSFDRILIAAAAPEPPAPLLAQLRDPGILLIPVGGADTQQLVRIEKRNGRLTPTEILDCRFVPLLGQHAWSAADYARARSRQ